MCWLTVVLPLGSLLIECKSHLNVFVEVVVTNQKCCRILMCYKNGCNFKQWKIVKKQSLRADWLIAPELMPGFCSMKRLGVFLLPLDRMLGHSRSFPHNLLGFSPTICGSHLYSWVERGTVRVKRLAQEHNTVSPARARTRTIRSGDKGTNHQATAPPQWKIVSGSTGILNSEG